MAPRLVGLVPHVEGRDEDGPRRRHHRRERQRRAARAEHRSHEQQLPDARLHGQRREVEAQRRERRDLGHLAVLGEGLEGVDAREELDRAVDGRGRRRGHGLVEEDLGVAEVQHEDLEDQIFQARPQDLRLRVGVELGVVGLARDEVERDARPHAARAAPSLPRGRARHEDLLERRQTPVRVVAVLLDARAVDDVDDVVDGDGRLGDVRRHDDLPRALARALEDGRLLRRRQLGVQREDRRPPLERRRRPELRHRLRDLREARHEDEDRALGVVLHGVEDARRRRRRVAAEDGFAQFHHEIIVHAGRVQRAQRRVDVVAVVRQPPRPLALRQTDDAALLAALRPAARLLGLEAADGALVARVDL
mmetsp:Transcript_23801/g.78855  ORF Transcript_23801/g.78855 Transcript_23801/m.78855 type:complete len:364 (+) Transcript_23801:1181-2272(+)